MTISLLFVNRLCKLLLRFDLKSNRRWVSSFSRQSLSGSHLPLHGFLLASRNSTPSPGVCPEEGSLKSTDPPPRERPVWASPFWLSGQHREMCAPGWMPAIRSIPTPLKEWAQNYAACSGYAVAIWNRRSKRRTCFSQAPGSAWWGSTLVASHRRLCTGYPSVSGFASARPSNTRLLFCWF